VSEGDVDDKGGIRYFSYRYTVERGVFSISLISDDFRGRGVKSWKHSIGAGLFNVQSGRDLLVSDLGGINITVK
jgi:hypothetical protein